MPKAILFVCLGNICRSPAAEGVLQQRLVEAGLSDQITVDSAGTASYHTGNAADARMIAAAAKRGYALNSRARVLSQRDLSNFDLIVAMDTANFRDIQALATGPAPHVKLFSDFLDGDWPRDVPDPYHGSSDGFETVLNMLEAAMPHIIAAICD